MKHKLFIVIFFFLFLSFSCRDNTMMDLIESPVEGDLYEVKLSENEYTVYRVFWLLGDSIKIYPQIDVVAERSNLKALIAKDTLNIYTYKDGLYQKQPVMYTVPLLKEDVEKGKILNVHRFTKFRKVHR